MSVVLVNILSAVSGGAQKYIKRLVPLLGKRFEDSGEHRMHLLLHESQQTLLGNSCGAERTLIGGVRPRGVSRLIWEAFNASSVVESVGADTLFIPYQVGFRAGSSRLVLMLRNLEPFFYDRYEYALKTSVRNRLLAWQTKRSLCKCDRVIAVSEFAAEVARDRLGIEDKYLRVIHHGRDDIVQPAHPVDSLSIDIDQPFIFTCGSVLPYRRLEDILDAYELTLPHLDHAFPLVIAGDGTDCRYKHKILQRIERSVYRDRIFMTGHVDPETAWALYRACSLFIMSTEIEACPNVAIEALSAGCPIVAADNRPLPEILADGAVYYRPRDTHALSDRMVESLSGSVEIQRAVNRTSHVAARFDWQRTAELTFRSLVEN